MIPLLFGIIIILVVIYIAFKILKNIIIGVIIMGLVMVASYLIIGSFPKLGGIPIIGRFLPELPTSTGEAIAYMRNVFYHLDILAVTRDINNNLLVTIANTGKLAVSGLSVYVDGNPVEILNQPKDPLLPKEATIIQVSWSGEYEQITIKTKQTTATFPD